MKRLFTAVALGLAAGSLSACRGDQRSPEIQRDEPIAVSVVAAVTIDTAERLEAGGVIAAPEAATVSSRVVATITDVRVRPGDRVRTGELLVRLDARDVIAQTHQARASALAAEKALTRAGADLNAAEAEHRLAAAWQQRIVSLHARNSATDQERDEAETRLAAAGARLAGAQASLEAAEAQLASAHAAVGVATATESFMSVRAPFDGLVTERLTDPGNLASPGMPLLRIESDGARQVVARVDEARATHVHPGDTVNVLIDVSAGGAVDPGIEGVVVEVARAVGPDQRTFTVKVRLPSGVTPRSGSFARIVFRGAARRVLLVPAEAIQRHGQVASVYVVQGDVARLRLVQLGASAMQGVEVLAGVDAGESIVASPAPRLVDGSRVTVGGASMPADGK